MFSKISRYNKLPDITITDSSNRILKSKALRLSPGVSGKFLHTVEETDRLDHLAYKYYKQPQKWWRICDANSEYMSPRSLLGKDSIKTTLFPLVWEGSFPPWSDLLKILFENIGIEHATLGTKNLPFPEIELLDGDFLFSIDEILSEDLDIGIRIQSFTESLQQALGDNGLSFLNGVSFSFFETSRWKIEDITNSQIYTFKLEEGNLNVFNEWNGTFLFNINANLTAALKKSVEEQTLSVLLQKALEENSLLLGTDLIFSVAHDWTITDLISKQVYTFKLEEDTINIYESITRSKWLLIVLHNETTVSAEDVTDLITSQGFIVNQPQTITRTGKQIIIPPNSP
ncbi:MAG: hypothetical protein PVG39_04005 [Desulfobacteraceae bacterium]|jgi:hypothetical protein